MISEHFDQIIETTIDLISVWRSVIDMANQPDDESMRLDLAMIVIDIGRIVDRQQVVLESAIKIEKAVAQDSP